jgi:hypothetical protein
MNLKGYEWAEPLKGVISIEIAIIICILIWLTAPCIGGLSSTGCPIMELCK